MTSPARETVRWQRGGRGGVSAGSHQACQAGVSLLEAGGNAFDAAIAVATTVAVTLPMSVGFGGDLVAVSSRRGERPEAVLALGAAPSRAGVEAFRALGHDRVPRTGILSATVPAFYDGLLHLHRRARLPLGEALQPAIRHASEGFMVTPQFSRWVANNASVITGDQALCALYLPSGGPPAEGTVHRNPPLAALLSRLASPGDHRTWLAGEVLEAARRHGGLFEEADVEAPAAETVPTASVAVGDARVHVTPAPTQGPVLALALAAASRLHDGRSPEEWPHVLAEVAKLAYQERLDHLGDPATGLPGLRYDGEAAAAMASAVGPTASPVPYGDWYQHGNTTSFVTADAAGGIVSVVVSLSLGFGAGVSALDGAVIFNNRLGRSATLDPAHANACRPRVRPVNTIHAWLVEEAAATAGGGTPGGDGQLQWNLQALTRRLLAGGSWAEAVAQPRFTVFPGADLIEAGMREHVAVDRGSTIVQGLRDRGHEVTERRDAGGCLRVLHVDADGVAGGDDGRQEGATVIMEPQDEE